MLRASQPVAASSAEMSWVERTQAASEAHASAMTTLEKIRVLAKHESRGHRPVRSAPAGAFCGSREARRLMMDADMHSWMVKRRPLKPVPRHCISNIREQMLRRCFESLDCDGNGMVDRNELAQALTTIGIGAEAVSDIFAEGDRNEDGQLSFDEFRTLAATYRARAAMASTGHRQPGKAEVTDLVDLAAAAPLRLLANNQNIHKLVDGFHPSTPMANARAANRAAGVERWKKAPVHQMSRASGTSGRRQAAGAWTHTLAHSRRWPAQNTSDFSVPPARQRGADIPVVKW